jgi:hypothetical protein
VQAPWREVTVIDDADGVRGAQQWRLTLACGHRVYRPKPRLTVERFAFNGRHKEVHAPARVRCPWCALPTAHHR